MRNSLEQALTSVALFVPKLVAFLVILIVGLLVAKALAQIIDKVLERVGFDKAVERGGVKKALARSKYDASDIVSKLVFYGLALFVLQLAFGVFGPNPVSDLLTGVIAFLPKLFVAIIIVVVASAIAKAVKDLIENALDGLSYGRVVANLASFFILALGVIAALNQIEVATTVTTPLLIAVLATIGGVIVVGVGGGLIGPMSQRWERMLSKAEAEAGNLKARTSPSPTSGASTASAPSGSSPAVTTQQLPVPPPTPPAA